VNPVVYLISGFRYSFPISTGMTFGFLLVCLAMVWWIFRSGWRLRN
jgi:ABC-2 type transport system permease protein